MKIKIFLAAYVNYTNAQNLNCYTLAKYLDKTKFKIYTLKLYSGDLTIAAMPGVAVFRCFYPHRLSKYLAFFWGIVHCDIAYLPKGELDSWCKFWLRVLKKKSFTTIEIKLGEGANTTMYSGLSKTYAITQYIKDYSAKQLNLAAAEKILYLGVEPEVFLTHRLQKKNLSDIVFIGHSMKRKGVFDYIALLSFFPQLTFHIVGDSEPSEKEALLVALKALPNSDNIQLHGLLDHASLAHLLQKCDLHVFPSRCEGFPKVTLEAAAAGVPSILYPDYGAQEWIKDKYNGFIVNSLDEIVETIQHLIDQPELLQEVSKHAVELAQQFDWKIMIEHWQKEIEIIVMEPQHV